VSDRTIYLDALDIPDPADRAAFLDRACADNPELRRHVEQLLAAHAGRGGVPGPAAHTSDTGHDGTPKTVVAPDRPPAVARGPTAALRGAPVTGQVLAGRYILGQSLGEGGMGSVYRAEQTHPVKRIVAVKLIRPGMDSERVVARFEAERQALAVMDHPHIAKVLDAGTTDAGQPFFVMELVHGTPLTAYCDRNRLTVRDRLELFVAVCQAVQHAHQKGVIHRDLKPGNILVAEVDGRPVPRGIDFGLAKALQAGVLPDVSLEAGGSVLGTMLYMAPEQAAGSADIDTRADVYALGVILYELLTGTTPLDRVDIAGLPLDEVVRRVREEEPPAPARRLEALGALAEVAAARRVEPGRLRKLVRGDLEWVTQKCLEKDRGRRYETAAAVAAEVQRYLADEPVSAGPPSRWYKARRFVRRNRGPVLAASLVLFVLVGGVVGTSVGLYRAEQRRIEAETAWAAEAARADAEREAKDQERKAKELALKQKDQIQRGVEVLGSVFRDLDLRKIEKEGERLDVVLGRRVKEVVAGLTAESVGDPLVVAELQNTLGLSLLNLGHYPDAIRVLEESRATRSRLLGPDHPDTLVSMANLAAGYLSAGKLDKALPMLEDVLALEKAIPGINQPTIFASMTTLASGYQAAGRLDQAISLYEEVLASSKSQLGPDHPYTLQGMNNLAQCYLAAGRFDRVVSLSVEAVTLMKARLGPDHPDTLTSMSNLAAGYHSTGRLDEAVPLYEETLALMKARLGPDHPGTLKSMSNLAEGYRDMGKLDQALPLCAEALALRKSKLGPDHPDTIASMNNLATCYWSARRLDQSVPLFEQVLMLRETKLGRPHPDTQMAVANLGVNYKDAGRLAEALPLLEEAHNTSRQHPAYLRWVTAELLDGYAKAGKTTEAATVAREVIADARRTLPKDSPPLANEFAQTGLSLLTVQAWTDAEVVLRECLAVREKWQPNAWNTFNTRSMLGGALLGQQKYAEAEPLLLAGYEGMKQREKTIPPQGAVRLPEAADRLVELYTALGKSEEVARWRAERAKYPPPTAPLPRAVVR
jgi:serine/threonine protein kinase/tetratricopeptide (TPR) repeat protein